MSPRPRMPRRLDLPAAPLAVARRLRDAGFETYVVGGAVRDALLGQPPGDVDLTTAASPEEVAGLFSRTHAIGAAFGVTQVIADDGTPVEVARFRRDVGHRDGRRPEAIAPSSVEEDVRRRDFTVNALLYDPVDAVVLDPVGGLQDLEEGVLRAIGTPAKRFAEDHLRLLRAVRFAAQLGFTIEASTWEALAPAAPTLARISAERIRHELDRMLTGPRPAQALRMLHYSGLLAEVLPEVAAMAGVPQPPEFHPEGDVMVHTLLVLEAVEPRTRVLAWGALLHDVGKPPTFRRAERIRFDRHVPVGTAMARDILTRLRQDNDTVERVCELVAQHLRFADAPRMRPATLKRFLRQPHFEDHLALHRADCLGSHRDLALHAFCREHLAALSEEDLRPPPLLRGRDLLEAGYRPGPRMGEILRAIEDGQLDGRLTTPDEAWAEVKARWPL